MLESLREIQSSKPGKLVVAGIMGLIMISFVIWGIGPVFTGFNANQIASVGSTTITIDQFRQAFQTQLQRLQQQAHRPITSAEAHQFGIDTQVLSQLVSEAVLDNEAHTLGLSISDQQIAKAILDDPSFKGADGKFDRSQFENVLRDNDLTEQTFVRQQRATYVRQELVQGLVGSLTVPQAAIDQLHRFQSETRSLDYVVLPPSAAGTLPQPDPAALKKFYDDRAPAYKAPEYRKLVILPIAPATVAKPGDVSDADVQKAYDQVKADRYSTPEYRTLQQIVFPSLEEAQAAAARIKAGTSFADLAKERKLTDKDIDLGRMTRDQVYEKPVAEAAFALPDNGVSDPIKTAFGATLVHVVAIEPGATKPLSDVQNDLREDLARSRSGTAIRSLRDKVDDARASGKTLTEAAQSAGLEARTIDAVDASGQDKTGKALDLPASAALLKAAFASDVGVDNDPVSTPDGGTIFFEVAAVDPARQQSFDEVKAKVEAQWREDQTASLLAKKADDLVKRVEGGETMEKVAGELGLPLQHVGDVRRNAETDVSQAVVAGAFNQSVGHAGSAAGDNGSRVIFRILGSIVPPLDANDPQTKQLTDQYANWLAEDLIGSTLTAFEGKLNVRINPDSFKNAIGS